MRIPSANRVPWRQIGAGQRQGEGLHAQSGWINLLESAMHALKDLFTSDVGLMSAAGIAFMLGMAVFYIRFFLRHMREDEARQRASKP